MNDMHQNAWLDFNADAQEAKQTLNRRYARMVDHFGSYKKMPQEMKDMFKDDYAAHKAKWGENGEEQQKRFGVTEPEYKSLADEKEAYLKKIQQTREQSKPHSMEVEV